MSELLKLEISGSNPVAHANQILQQYANDDGVQSVTVEITSKGEGETSDTTEPVTSGESSDIDKTNTEREQEKQRQREKGDIRGGTSHHHVLHALAQFDGPIASREVKDAVEGVGDSSIYPALTQLWERKLADRERVEYVDNPYYKYEITDYGRQKLNELGEPEPPKVEG